MEGRDVLIIGGTGYVGRALARALCARGHRVRVLARRSSLAKVGAGCVAVVGDALNAESIRSAMRRGDVVVQLVGTPHPGPMKGEDFRRVDLASVTACVQAAESARIARLVYVSVAHPAPVMRAYIAVRREAERVIREARLPATILRPWYVLGPGHWWPVVLLPVYALASRIPSLQSGAERLGLVTLGQIVRALTLAVEEPVATGEVRVMEVGAIRAA